MSTEDKPVPKNILLLVTGMTPQIVTETIYGLAIQPSEDKPVWIPDEVHVISTGDGLNQIRSRLFNSERKSESGYFKLLQHDYPQLAHIKFDESCLHPICNHEGNILADLKTPHDNEQAANIVCEQIAKFTTDEHVSLHVSIAGGRKTMGFYAGYALSLYGRAQDSMSHVLVEDKFESSPNFFYPTPTQSFVTDRNGKDWDASKAQVWLASIPFVRLRGSLSKKSLLQNATFSEVVAAINLANSSEEHPIDIVIKRSLRIVCIGEKEIKFPPREFAFYTWFAELKLAGEQTVSSIVEGENLPIPRLFELWKGNDSIDPTDPKSGTFDKPFFEQRLAKIKEILISNLGLEVTKLVNIVHKDKRGSGYIFAPSAQQITILD